jgi:hypothetical protein
LSNISDYISLISTCNSFSTRRGAIFHRIRLCAWVVAAISLISPAARAQESPYIVAYNDDVEERGNLEVEYFSTFGIQRGGNDFHAFWLELEYGATSRWTTGLYLDGQTTLGQSTIFTGARFENRFRPFKREHGINPVLYFEYEHKNGADKILKEVEGHDVASDFLVPNNLARRDHLNELEFKLILSSTVKGWNFTQNTLAAKNLSNNPWEFGYALGVSHPLSMKPSTRHCALCLQTFDLGVEMYGGLGDRHSFGLHETSHYLAPVVSWNPAPTWTVRVSTGFGFNDTSQRLLVRWGVAHDFPDFGQKLARLFRNR